MLIEIRSEVPHPMKQRNKLLALILSLAMALSLSSTAAIPAFAIGGADSSASQSSIDSTAFLNELTKSAVRDRFAGGSGTASDPWQITDAFQMSAMRFRPQDHFVLCNDIDMSTVSHWTPIGLFLPQMTDMEEASTTFAWCGELDGNGKTIRNFTASSAQPMGIALFGVTAGDAYIHDLTMENCNVSGLMYVGSLVGLASGNTTLRNIDLIGTNNIKGLMYVGGLVGGGSNPVNENLSASANVTMTAKGLMKSMNAQAAGVLYGGAEGCNFENCRAHDGTVTALGSKVNSIGGLAGCAHQSGFVKNCTAENITINVADAVMVGGLVGASANNEGLTDCTKRTLFSGNTVSNVTIQADAAAERIGMLTGGGFYTASTKKDFAEPGAFVLTDNTVSGTIKGGKYVGAVTAYLSRNSVVANNTTNVLWNGNPLTAACGADTVSVPVSQL